MIRNAEVAVETLLGLYGNERDPKRLAREVMELTDVAHYHRISETGPATAGTRWYAECSCGTRFESDESVDAAWDLWDDHQRVTVFARIN